MNTRSQGLRRKRKANSQNAMLNYLIWKSALSHKFTRSEGNVGEVHTRIVERGHKGGQRTSFFHFKFFSREFDRSRRYLKSKFAELIVLINFRVALDQLTAPATGWNWCVLFVENSVLSTIIPNGPNVLPARISHGEIETIQHDPNFQRLIVRHTNYLCFRQFVGS